MLNSEISIICCRLMHYWIFVWRLVIRYCDCFASGVVCTDCDCVDCHNNSEKCDAREAAMVNVLGRNPNAFSEKALGSLTDNQVCSW